jgi:hypothetical protein
VTFHNSPSILVTETIEEVRTLVREALLTNTLSLEEIERESPQLFTETESPEPFAEAVALQEKLTVVLFTSPIPSHPNTWILENVYSSIRRHLPHVRIVILADGTECEEPASYRQFKERAQQKGWELIAFKGKHHQTLMLRHALLTPGLIETPLLMVGEGDWGILRLFIDWQANHRDAFGFLVPVSAHSIAPK